jgi:hypothetical protein
MTQPLQRHDLFQKILSVLCIGVLVVAMLYVKAYTSALQALARGEAAYQSGKRQEAILNYEQTIKWYTPLSSSVRLAVERLWSIGTEAEQHADAPLALQAYQALRSSLYAVQSFYLPYRDWIPKSEAKIASLMAQTARTQARERATLAPDTARFTQMLQRHVGANVGWSILAEIGFISWVGATVGLLWYAVSSHGTWVWRQGLLWGSGIAVGFTTWIIGMLYA